MINKIFVTLIVLSLISCVQSSGILKLGPDTYSILIHAAPIQGGTIGAKRIALQEANKHCLSLNKEILVSNTGLSRSIDNSGGKVDVFSAGGVSEITFFCLDKNDPHLKRREYKPTTKIMPDFSIEENMSIQR